jgi:hypothetical protein
VVTSFYTNPAMGPFLFISSGCRTSYYNPSRITTLTLAFLIFFVASAQTYSLAAGADSLNSVQEASTNKDENSSQEVTIEESQNSGEDVSNDETHTTVNVGELEEMGDEISPETSLIVPVLPWIGMGIGELLAWLGGGAAAGLAIYKFGQEVVAVRDFVQELSKNNNRDKPVYYKAKTDKSGLYILGTLKDKNAAKTYVTNSNNEVWASSYNDASALARSFGSATRLENHYDTGYSDTKYYNHFHGITGNKRSGHIFYGADYVWGANRR